LEAEVAAEVADLKLLLEVLPIVQMVQQAHLPSDKVGVVELNLLEVLLVHLG
jgi:hypothetical protein